MRSAYQKAQNDVYPVAIKGLPMPSGEYVWAAGDARLAGESVYQAGAKFRMTWLQFGTALLGIDKYERAYPGLYFAYKIFVSESGVRYQIGRGALTVRQDPWGPGFITN